jgi:hypothetical protein
MVSIAETTRPNFRAEECNLKLEKAMFKMVRLSCDVGN